jgi:tetratricopeptide (TPR) repeat protein
VVFDLAREAIRAVPPEAAAAFGARGLARVAAVFDALQVLKVVYVPDPNSPYSRVRHEAGTVDLVQYPRQTLARRTGDCDDTSALVAALLGSVGIDTRLVDAPGHLFLLVDTGVHARNRVALSLDDHLSVVIDDGVWIPLETTAIDKGFTEAWKLGAEAYGSWAARGEVQSVAVAEAQSRYEPADLPGEAVTPVLDPAPLGALLAEDGAAIRSWREAYQSAHYLGAMESQVSGEALDELAHVYFLAGKLDSARVYLERALAGQPASARLHNNLAVTLAALGDLDGALAHFDSALETDASDPGLWLNLGLAHVAAGDSAGAEEPLAQGVERSGGFENACRLLGVSVRQEASREGTPRMSADEIRALLQAAARRVPRAPVKSVGGGAKPAPAPAVTPVKPGKLRVGATRSALPDIQNYLYWKE